MGDSLTLCIAGVAFQVEVPSPDWSTLLRQRYQEFLIDETVGLRPWHVRLECDPSLVGEDAAWIRHDEAVTRFRVSGFEGWIDLAQRRARVTSPGVEWGPSAAERVLAYVCMQVLPREHESLLLHGVALVLDGHGLALCGPSGAGKTTIGRLAAGRAEVWTDESLVIALSGAQPTLVSTPFWGASTPEALIRRVNRQTALHAICLLEHGQDFEMELLSPSRATVGLLATEKVAVERVSSAEAWLAVVERTVTMVPVYRLRFLPEPRLWSFLSEQLSLIA